MGGGHLRPPAQAWLVVWLLSVCALPGQEQSPATNLPTLTSASQIIELSAEQANLHYPVRVQGVITYSDPVKYLAFVQDSSGGVYLDLQDEGPKIRSGELVEIRGRSASGIFAPIIEQPVVNKLGIAVMPSPRRATLQELFSGALDSQWLELEGVVRTADLEGSNAAIMIAASGGQFTAIIPHRSPDQLESLVDSLVSVRGVCAGLYNQKDQLIGTQLYVPDWTNLSVLKPAPSDPFALPLRQVSKLLEFAPARGTSHRVRVRGTVTLARPGHLLFIRDETAGLYVTTRQDTLLQPGDRVEVAGFPESGGYTPALGNSIFRKIDAGPPPVPAKATSDGFASGAYDAELIEIEGLLLGKSPNAGQRVFAMQSNFRSYNAILPLDKKDAALDRIPDGSRLRLTGVCSVQADEFRRPAAYRLLLRSAADVEVLSRPAWWKLEYTLAIAGLLLVSVLASLGWVLVLNRRVRAQTGIIRERLEREAALVTQLQQSQKMEAIGSLAGGVAHDFNNILTAILGYTEMVLARLKPGDAIREDLDAVHKAGEKAASLTRQLLAFSRRQLMQPKVLDLNSIVRELDKMLRRLIGEDVELSTHLAPDLGCVKVDPSQIEQVIMNLVVNARDAMPKGGKLRIATANAEWDPTRGSVLPEPERKPFVMLSVSDDGCGIARELVDHIFEPFFTTKTKGNGTGLGLATVYGIVKQSGGDITVHSELGRGTTFKIYLPRVAGDLALEATSQCDPPQRGSEGILLVEDDQGVRDLARRVLEGSGYNVLAACDGMEAIQVCDRTPGIRLLLTDVVMPKMSGRELVERLTAAHPDIKTLYISGYTDDTTVRHGVLENDIPLLQKPFSPETLVRAVREVLDTAPKGH
jgi:signal transduction histidine kinase/CheY-like chemotaxis protein